MPKVNALVIETVESDEPVNDSILPKVSAQVIAITTATVPVNFNVSAVVKLTCEP